MKTFTKNPIPGSLLALLLLIAAIACKKDKKTDLSGDFTIAHTKTSNFEQNGNIIASITLTAVEDSRCPINALCATAGVGKATVKIKDLSIKAEKEITLYIGDGVPKDRKDLKQININGTDYTLQLKNISSSPQAYVSASSQTYDYIKLPLTAFFSLTKL